MRRWGRKDERKALADGDAAAEEDSSYREITLVKSKRGRAGLKARLEVHEIETRDGALVCCSYVSDGLSALGQKEIVFTIRGELGEELPDLRPALEWFKAVYHFSEQGRLVDVGDFSQFGVGPWGPFAAIAYTQPEEPLAIEAPAALLRGVLLTEEEIEVAKEFGFSRVLARLGRAYRHYPFPPWVATRESVASHDEMEATILAKVPHLRSRHASVVLLHDREVILSLTEAAGEELRRALAGWTEAPFAILPPIERTANGCLVWEPGQPHREAITPEGSDGSRLSCCFLLLGPGQPANGGRPVEDGVAIELTSTSWAALLSAIDGGAPTTIPAETEGLSLSLRWASEAA
jgi:hypothetical protein